MISDDIIIPTLEHFGERIDDAYEQIQRGRQQWVEGTLELASALREARDQFPSNAAFSAWLTESGRDRIGHNDRAALINMAAADAIEVTRIVLAETERMSWRHIWDEEVKPRLTHAGKMAKIMHLTKIPQRETPSEQITTPLPSDAASSHEGETAKVVELAEIPQEAALSWSPQRTATLLPNKTSAPLEDKRDDNYIAAVKKFSDETTAARGRVGEFSPKAAARVVQLIDWIKGDLGALQQELRLKIDSEMQLSQPTQH